MANSGPKLVTGDKLRVAIWRALCLFIWNSNSNQLHSGGGIGGLCLAVSLSRHAHLDVNLYESAGQFKEIGAGVMIWARTWRILEKMGLAPEFSKIAHAPPTGAQGQTRCYLRCERIHFTLRLPQGIGFDYRRSDQPSEGFRFKLVEMPCKSWRRQLCNLFKSDNISIDGVCFYISYQHSILT